MEILFYILLGFNLFYFGVALFNWLTAPVIRNQEVGLESTPFISVLIPARNEEENLPNVLQSLDNQTYKNFEVIVLDDNSEDNTSQILEQFNDTQLNLTKLEGKPLPEDWLGKNWACHQLSEKAQGELLLFIDADVRLSPNTLAFAVFMFHKNSLDMLSCFSTQTMEGLGSLLTIPLVNWLLLTFLPLRFVSWFKSPSLAAANGQFIMITRNVYNNIGGHVSVKQNVVEDMAFAKSVKKLGYKLQTTLGGDAVYCRMYNSFSDGVEGFAKNFYPGFSLPPVIFYVLISFFLFVFFLPFVLTLFSLSFVWVIIVILSGRLVISLISQQNPLINVFLHPFQMLVMFYIGIVSVTKFSGKNIKWKGRKLNLNS